MLQRARIAQSCLFHSDWSLCFNGKELGAALPTGRQEKMAPTKGPGQEDRTDPWGVPESFSISLSRSAFGPAPQDARPPAVISSVAPSRDAARHRPALKKRSPKGVLPKGAKGGPENALHKYRGVRQRTWGRWVAEIREPHNRTRVWLGSFNTAEEAAQAYDRAARVVHGSKARLNLGGNSCPAQRAPPGPAAQDAVPAGKERPDCLRKEVELPLTRSAACAQAEASVASGAAPRALPVQRTPESPATPMHAAEGPEEALGGLVYNLLASSLAAKAEYLPWQLPGLWSTPLPVTADKQGSSSGLPNPQEDSGLTHSSESLGEGGGCGNSALGRVQCRTGMCASEEAASENGESCTRQEVESAADLAAHCDSSDSALQWPGRRGLLPDSATGPNSAVTVSQPCSSSSLTEVRSYFAASKDSKDFSLEAGLSGTLSDIFLRLGDSQAGVGLTELLDLSPPAASLEAGALDEVFTEQCEHTEQVEDCRPVCSERPAYEHVENFLADGDLSMEQKLFGDFTGSCAMPVLMPLSSLWATESIKWN